MEIVHVALTFSYLDNHLICEIISMNWSCMSEIFIYAIFLWILILFYLRPAVRVRLLHYTGSRKRGNVAGGKREHMISNCKYDFARFIYKSITKARNLGIWKLAPWLRTDSSVTHPTLRPYSSVRIELDTLVFLYKHESAKLYLLVCLQKHPRPLAGIELATPVFCCSNTLPTHFPWVQV